MDITQSYTQVKEVTWVSALLMVLSAVIVLITTSLLVRRALKPMRELKKTAENIAGGAYDLRVQVNSEDEVAAMAKSFNRMADAVETRIDELTEQSERRRLLLGALAHELKTPMTAVIGFADSLLKMPLTEEQRYHCAQQILAAGQRTERISRKLMLLLPLSEEGHEIDKQEFAPEQLADELRQLYGARVNIASKGRLTGDRDLLFSLVQNLINNALNASKADSAVDVTLGDHFICVSDRGSGIPPEHIPRLTEPFYRVDKARSRRYGGAGLGLSLCSAIAEAHGAKLTIDSKPGVGTTVTVNFNSGDSKHES